MANLLKNFFQKNELDILTNENKLRAEYLSLDNKILLKRLMKCLSVSRLSSFDIQIFQKDCIGMALEAEQRGKTLNDVVGNDMHTFCKEMASNGRKRTWKEYIMLSIPYIFLTFTIIYGMNYIFINSCPPIMKITLSDLFFYLMWCLIGVVVADYFIKKSIFNTTFKKGLSLLIRPAALLMLIAINNIFDLKQIILTEVIGWLPFVVTIILTFVFFAFKNDYLNHLAKNYNWSDQ
jgi:DNA-binding ferritin-like protein (Dps family)